MSSLSQDTETITLTALAARLRAMPPHSEHVLKSYSATLMPPVSTSDLSIPSADTTRAHPSSAEVVCYDGSPVDSTGIPKTLAPAHPTPMPGALHGPLMATVSLGDLVFDPALSESEQAILREEVGILSGLRDALGNFSPAWKDPHYDESLLELRDSLGEAHEDELPQIVAQMDRLASLSAHQQRQSPAVALPDTDSPYFGHMRVRQGGRERDILIGNQTLASLDIPYPIIDWRHAPI